VIKDLGGVRGLWMLGVMDGHGLNGHLVSDLVKKQLPAQLGSLIAQSAGGKYDFRNPRLSITVEKRAPKKSPPGKGNN
jgi:serine/threonine protein phosphatase PrpC